MNIQAFTLFFLVLSNAVKFEKMDAQQFQKYSYFAELATCKETWELKFIPPGNKFEQNNPSKLEFSIYDPKTTLAGLVVRNDNLQIIVVSFRPASTNTLWKYVIQNWKSKGN